MQIFNLLVHSERRFFGNEEIVRRYPGSDNGGNYVIDKGKGSGPRSHDYGEVIAEELGGFGCKYV